MVYPDRELPSCEWCSFSEPNSDNRLICKSTEQWVRTGVRRVECNQVAIRDCQSYRPSLLTRALRVVGLRKPVMDSVLDARDDESIESDRVTLDGDAR